MRRSISKIPYRPTTIGASFSTASGGGGVGGGGGGRGRGRGAGAPTHFQFTLDDSPSHGRGRGRGGSSPVLPSFLNNNASNSAASGRGRGFVPTNPPPPLGEQSEVKPAKPNPGAPYQFILEEDEARFGSAEPQPEHKPLPEGIFDALSGMGRGKHSNFSPKQPQKPNAETERPQTISRATKQPTKAVTRDTGKEQLSAEEKVRKAMGLLSRGGDGGPPPVDRGVRDERAERGGRGGGGGRGRGRGRGRGEYGGREFRDDRDDEVPDGPTGQYFGDPADEEKVAKRLGPENMNKIVEGFEEMSGKVMPSPYEDALVDAYETNLMLECEPEYFMEEFGTNPDIDEKPPMSLREALEKTKPFFMKYEGIQNQEEWEEIVEATMKNVPLLKSVVDHYAGPDRVTAKQQIGELERVAKTLPASAPASVKRFTDRAVLSLQNNPGWGWNKKWQFMDKLAMEVSQQYK